MAKNTSSKNNNDVLNLIKSVGGIQPIYKHLTSKGYKINIDSIYKWKTNGIPHRYRTIINELKNKNNNKSNNTDIEPEIISNYWNSNNFYKILFIIILIIIFFLFYNQNEKKLDTLYSKINNLEKELINTKNNNEKAIKEIDKKFEIQSNINTENNEKINKIHGLYSAHEEKLNKVQSSPKIVNNEENEQKLNYIINHNDALFYLLWLKDNFNNKINRFNKLPFLLEFISKNDLPVDIEKSLSIIANLDKIDLKSDKELLTDIRNILSNNKDKNIEKNDKINNILNKIKNLIRISKINNNTDKKLLLENLNRELTNRKYDNALYLISSNKIEPSKKLNIWIESINTINNLDQSINKIINWIINKG
tara:strand:- start:29834 stop:30928 length:1095 start_codon:yes stop_codon:yes gene_type:complete